MRKKEVMAMLFNPLNSALISCGHCNKLLQARWLRTTKYLFSCSPEAWSLKSVLLILELK